MAWGFHGGASTAPGTAGGHYAGPGYIGNQSPAHHSPHIKSEAEIKQDILDARQKQLYGWGSSGFVQPTSIDELNQVWGPQGAQVKSPLSRVIELMRGRLGDAQFNYQGGAKRLNVNIPLLNAGGGLISGQGSWSPYGGNYLGFQYKKDW